MLATAGDDGKVILWSKNKKLEKPTEDGSVESWIPVRCFTGCTTDILSLSWAPDSSHIFCGCFDGTLVVFRLYVQRNTPAMSLRMSSSILNGLAIDPLLAHIVVEASNREMRLADIVPRGHTDWKLWMRYNRSSSQNILPPDAPAVQKASEGEDFFSVVRYIPLTVLGPFGGLVPHQNRSKATIMSLPVDKASQSHQKTDETTLQANKNQDIQTVTKNYSEETPSSVIKEETDQGFGKGPIKRGLVKNLPSTPIPVSGSPGGITSSPTVNKDILKRIQKSREGTPNFQLFSGYVDSFFRRLAFTIDGRYLIAVACEVPLCGTGPHSSAVNAMDSSVKHTVHEMNGKASNVLLPDSWVVFNPDSATNAAVLFHRDAFDIPATEKRQTRRKAENNDNPQQASLDNQTTGALTEQTSSSVFPGAVPPPPRAKHTTAGSMLPAIILPGHRRPTIAVATCSIIYRNPHAPEQGDRADIPVPPAEGLKGLSESQRTYDAAELTFPFRQVFAVASLDGVAVYALDCSASDPNKDIVTCIFRAAGFHSAGLTDVAFSRDGRLLAVSSTDGLVSLLALNHAAGTPVGRVVCSRSLPRPRRPGALGE